MGNLMMVRMLLMMDLLLLLLVHIQPWRVDATHRSRVDNSRVGDMIELGLMDAIGGMRRPGVHVDRKRPYGEPICRKEGKSSRQITSQDG